MKKGTLSLFAFLFAFCAFSQQRFELNGYVKLLPQATFITKDIPAPLLQFFYLDHSYVDFQVHNRLNMKYRITESLELNAGLRNRLFWGFTQDNPSFKEAMDFDPGIFDGNWVYGVDGQWTMQHSLDRFYLHYQKKKWEFTAGRQRINWGMNTVFNPNDIFNSYSPFDFDYEERPGSDAVRIRYDLEGLSEMELAFSIRNGGNMVLAPKYLTNYKGYDLQVFSGIASNDSTPGNPDWVSGFGWAGNLKNAGFKGEVTYYFSATEPKTENAFLLSATVDYMFGNGLYVMGSYLFNSYVPAEGQSLFPTGQDAGFFGMNRVLTPKSLFFLRSTAIVVAGFNIHPLVRFDLTNMVSTYGDYFIVVPTLTYSATSNTDLLLVSQIFLGDQPISQDFGFLSGGVFLRLKYSFAAGSKSKDNG